MLASTFLYCTSNVTACLKRLHSVFPLPLFSSVSIRPGPGRPLWSLHLEVNQECFVLTDALAGLRGLGKERGSPGRETSGLQVPRARRVRLPPARRLGLVLREESILPALVGQACGAWPGAPPGGRGL